MRRALDFRGKHVDKILGFDPAISSSGGMGYACANIDAQILGGTKNKPFLSHCGLHVPFASLPRTVCMEELCDKSIDDWRHKEGFASEPKVLIIENPIIYPNSPVRRQDLIDLSKFAGKLSRCFQPQLKLEPAPNTWKGNSSKIATQAHVLRILDPHSKKVLERDLANIPVGKRHNVFDALGLVYYAALVLLKKLPMPVNNYQSKEFRISSNKAQLGEIYARY